MLFAPPWFASLGLMSRKRLEYGAGTHVRLQVQGQSSLSLVGNQENVLAAH